MDQKKISWLCSQPRFRLTKDFFCENVYIEKVFTISKYLGPVLTQNETKSRKFNIQIQSYSEHGLVFVF